MQAIKYIDIPANGADEVTRPTSYPEGNSTKIFKDDSDLLNTEIATFLSDCGVDAFFGVKEDEEYEWLWINDMPLYFFTKPSDTYPIIRVYVPGSSSAKWINESEILSNRLVLNFCGNPGGAFLFRVFSINFSVLYYMFAFSKVRSSLSNKVYPSIRTTAGIASSVGVVHTFVDDSRTKSYTFSTSIPLVGTAKPFLADDIGENTLGLVPVQSVTESSTTVNVPSILALEGVYLYPINTVIPDGAAYNSLYQTEISIDNRKFLVAYANTDASSTIRLGLVALEDDDPLISEDDLMSEVET